MGHILAERLLGVVNPRPVDDMSNIGLPCELGRFGRATSPTGRIDCLARCWYPADVLRVDGNNP
eukprot:6569281-Lingulodinium_polyedra.AAC.1